MMNKFTLLTAFLTILTIDTSFGQTYFSDDFSSGNLDSWILVDSDGDNNNWTAVTYNPDLGQGGVAFSASWNPASGTPSGPLNPDNWMISSSINLSGVTGAISLSWKVYAQDQRFPAENYSVYVGTDSTVVSLSGNPAQFTEVLTTSSAYMERIVDLSSFADSTIYIGFRHHNVSDKFRMNIDDIKVFKPLSKDLQLTSVTPDHLFIGNADTIITGTVKNNGSTPVTDFNVIWTDGTQTETQNITGVNIAYGASYSFTHSVPVNIEAGKSRAIKVYIDYIGDENSSNDTLNTTFSSLLFLPKKIVVGEEATGTWCGWCPRGAVALEKMANDYPNEWIGIAVHNGDPMTITEYDNGLGTIGSGYPRGVVDRIVNGDPGNFETMFQSAKQKVAPADINLSAKNTNGEVAITVEAQFAIDANSHPYRFNVVIVENNVTGTTSGYNQANYYAGGGNGNLSGAGHDWHSAANPVPAADMVYDDVARAILGGWNGSASSIPNSIESCAKYTFDYTYTLPTNAVDSNFEVVAMLIDTVSGAIVNGKKVHLGESTITEEDDPQACKTISITVINDDFFNLNIYPNPTSDILNIKIGRKSSEEVDVILHDVLGRVVDSKITKNGEALFQTKALNKGVYYINVKSKGEIIATSNVMLK